MQHVARSHARARHTTGHPAPAARASACDGVDGRGPSVNWCVSCWAFAHMKQPGGLGYKTALQVLQLKNGRAMRAGHTTLAVTCAAWRRVYHERKQDDV